MYRVYTLRGRELTLAQVATMCVVSIDGKPVNVRPLRHLEQPECDEASIVSGCLGHLPADDRGRVALCRLEAPRADGSIVYYAEIVREEVEP